MTTKVHEHGDVGRQWRRRKQPTSHKLLLLLALTATAVLGGASTALATTSTGGGATPVTPGLGQLLQPLNSQGLLPQVLAPLRGLAHPVGMNFGGQYMARLAQSSPLVQDATLKAVAASGVNSVRLDVAFPSVEAQPGVFKWGNSGLISEAIKDGLSVDAVLDYVPDWARMADGSPQPAAYATYAAQTVRHLAPLGVHVFELGNEENMRNGATPVVPADYTELLQAAYPAIKAADPTATVLLGGLGNTLDQGLNGLSSSTFLTDVYADGGGPFMDGIAVHPDSSPVAPMTPASWNPFYNLPSLHAISARYGYPSTPVWITEYGAATSGTTYTVTPAAQASDMTAAYQQARQWPWVAGFYFFEWQDNPADLGMWGVTTTNGTPKPALNAIRTLFNRPTSTASVAQVGSFAPATRVSRLGQKAVAGFEASPAGALNLR